MVVVLVGGECLSKRPMDHDDIRRAGWLSIDPRKSLEESNISRLNLCFSWLRYSIDISIEIFPFDFHWYSFPFRFSLKSSICPIHLSQDKIWPAGSMPAWQGCQGCQGWSAGGRKSHPQPICTTGDFTVCYRTCFISRWICLLRMVIVHSYIKLPDGSLVSWYIYIYVVCIYVYIRLWFSYAWS